MLTVIDHQGRIHEEQPAERIHACDGDAEPAGELAPGRQGEGAVRASRRPSSLERREMPRLRAS
jgi:hypothetical protein